MATLGGHQYSGGFSSGPLGQGGFPGQGGGGFGAMGSAGGKYYKPPATAAVAPRPIAPKPAAAPFMPQFIPSQMLNVGGVGLPGYGAQVPQFSFFGPSYGGAVPGGMIPGGMMQSGTRPPPMPMGNPTMLFGRAFYPGQQPVPGGKTQSGFLGSLAGKSFR